MRYEKTKMAWPGTEHTHYHKSLPCFSKEEGPGRALAAATRERLRFYANYRNMFYMSYPLRVIDDTYVFLDPADDCDAAALALEEYGYGEEFCVARDFDSGFAADLMAAGFLVMSEVLSGEEGDVTILFPKHHLIRSCLFFPDLHIKKSIKSKLSRYELRFDSDFDLIVDKCVEVHGGLWLTPAFTALVREMRSRPALPARPVSFGLYRNGQLKAGEFGVIAGRVYTSYSGYYEEDNAGTAQMILSAKYLEARGFAFWDLGMPLDYKPAIGAKEISRAEFQKHFFAARN